MKNLDSWEDEWILSIIDTIHIKYALVGCCLYILEFPVLFRGINGDMQKSMYYIYIATRFFNVVFLVGLYSLRYHICIYMYMVFMPFTNIYVYIRWLVVYLPL